MLAAVSLYPVPEISNDRPLNVATPLEAFKVVVPDNVPEGPDVLVKVIEAEEELTIFPKASFTFTTGCVVKAVPATAPAGS